MDKQEKEIVKRNEIWIKMAYKNIAGFEEIIKEQIKDINELAEQNRILKGRE